MDAANDRPVKIKNVMLGIAVAIAFLWMLYGLVAALYVTR